MLKKKNITKLRGKPCKKASSNSHRKKKPTASNQPLEDRVLKAAAQFMGNELLPLMGISGTIRRIAPTEQVWLQIKNFQQDFNYEMEDNTWTHLEFE